MRMQTDKKIAVVHIRLTPQQRDKFYRIGGSGWLRRALCESYDSRITIAHGYVGIEID